MYFESDAMNFEGLKYKPVYLYLKDIVLDPMPNFSNAKAYVYFEVTQQGRQKTYVSWHILCRKNERTVSLSVNPPILPLEDMKIEFISKPKFGETFFGFKMNSIFTSFESRSGGLRLNATVLSFFRHKMCWDT